MTADATGATAGRKYREHGTNARYRFGEIGNDYRNGCRCHLCTDAGVLYEKQRANRKRRGWQPYVDNTEARAHLAWLETQSVGLRAVAAASGLTRSQLGRIRSGSTTRSRPETIAAVLAVGKFDAKPGAVVDGTRTLQLIDELRALGHTNSAIAQALGSSKKALQVCRRGTLLRSTADKVEALHREWTAERDAQRQYDAERQADYRQRRADGRLNYTRAAS